MNNLTTFLILLALFEWVIYPIYDFIVITPKGAAKRAGLMQKLRGVL